MKTGNPATRSPEATTFSLLPDGIGTEIDLGPDDQGMEPPGDGRRGRRPERRTTLGSSRLSTYTRPSILALPVSSPSPPRRTRWDERYADGDWEDDHRPAPILRDAAPWLPPPGVALDLACGAGRNTLHLARMGWKVLGVDLSIEGLRILARRGRAQDLPVLPVLADAGRFALRPGSVDLVVNTRFLLRSTFPLILNVLRPGAVLLFETFSVLELEALGGDIRREFAVERGELRRAFGSLEVLLHEEGVFESPEGERGLARFVGRKPRRPLKKGRDHRDGVLRCQGRRSVESDAPVHR